ncbi:MAG: DUF7507 domain-containing protein, partial [Thermomicrobiales bacterium]
MRQPTRILGIAVFAALLLAMLAIVRWGGAQAQEQTGPSVTSSSRVASSTGGGPMLRLVGETAGAAVRRLDALQDVPLTVGRECPAVLLEDGSVSVWVTVSSTVPLTSVAVVDDVGTPGIVDDDLVLSLIEGDLDVDGVLDPGELWGYALAFFPAPGTVGDTVHVSGQDETLAVVTGLAACEFLPTAPPPAPTEIPAEPTATAAPTKEPATDTSFTAADEGGADDGSFTIAADGTPTVTKSSEATEIPAGEPISFTIDVVNPGPNPIFLANLEDVLPEELGLLWEITGWTGEGVCTIEEGDGFLFVNCELGTLTAGETFQVQISSDTTFDTCGSVDNRAVLYGALDDAGPVEERASTDFVTVDVDCPPLVVEKVANGDGIINAGNLAIFTVTVRAIEDVFDVFAEDTLPDDLGWIAQSPDDECSVTGDEVYCSIGDMSAGEVFEFSVERSTTSADCGDLVNAAHAEQASSFASFSAAQEGDPSTDEATITVLCPDLRVEQSPDLAVFDSGEDAVFTVTVFNDGPGQARFVELVNQLAPGIVWTDDFEDGDSGSCDITSGELSCSFGAIAAGESVTITLTGATGPEDCSDFHFNNAEVSASNEPVSADDNNFANVEFAIRCPSIRVDKNSLPGDTISAGSIAEYRILVANDGPGDAIGVTLTDELPDGVDWFIPEGGIQPTFEGADYSCAIVPDTGETDQVLTCTVASIPSSEGFIVFVDGLTDPADCAAPLENTASAEASNELPDSTFSAAADSASATITVLCPDIGIQKTTVDADISAGETASYTVTASNAGPGAAFGVTITDPLPAGVDWQEAPDNPQCSIASGVLSCNAGNIAPSGTFSVTVEGSTDAFDCGDPLSNTATVDASNDDPVPTAPVTITVECPGLSIDKTVGTDSISAGETASFTIDVTNTGGGNATGVTISDTLPDGIVWEANPDTDCTVTGAELLCEIAALAPDGDFSVTVEGETDPADCGTLENQATADAENGESVTSTLVEIDVNCPDLTVEKVAEDDEISAGENAVFNITVTNTGAGEATGVILSDTLPDGITWTALPDTDCTVTGQELSCDVGTLSPADSETDADEFSVTMQGQTDSADCGDITNTATAIATNHDEIDSAATVTVNCAELLVTKDAADLEISAGEDVSYTITVSNLGAGTATDVTVEDTVPAGIAWTEGSDDCTVDGPNLLCEFGDLGSTEEASVTITGTTGPEDCGEISNTATAGATNTDPATSAPAVITILCPGVAVTKVADAEAVAAGAEIGFTLTVTNPRVANAFGVSLVDELPAVAGLSWEVDGGADADDCAIDDGVLTCDVGTLPGGQSRVVHIASPSTDESCGAIENSATVEADNEPDDLGDNNTATATIAVHCASISVVKIATDGLGAEIATADVDDTITYLYFVANTGAAPLTDIAVLDDHLPVEGNLCPAGTTLEPDDGIPGSGADEVVCAGEYLVGEIDITDDDGLTLTNLATTSGVSPLGDEVTATDDATVTINEPKAPCEFPVTFT